MKHYQCLSCGKECNFSHNKRNKYCGPVCQNKHIFETVKKPMIEKGLLNARHSLALLIKYVSNRDGYKCSNCGLENWLGKTLSLDLDHIDGNNKNNKPDNLRLLCPNCHRQTPTWGNKKRD